MREISAMAPTDHVWVEFQYMPIEVEVLPGGDIGIKYNDDDKALAEEQAKHACYLCEVPLTADLVATECAGEPAG
jgi:hypothetical protein